MSHNLVPLLNEFERQLIGKPNKAKDYIYSKLPRQFNPNSFLNFMVYLSTFSKIIPSRTFGPGQLKHQKHLPIPQARNQVNLHVNSTKESQKAIRNLSIILFYFLL